METKKLPDALTYLDIIKTLAVIVMIIDHVGLYFFQNEDWFRTIGRIGMPVWFFMIGYASTRALPNRLLIGAFILAAVDFLLFQKLFAMNALVTIMLLRLSIDHVMNFITQSRYLFYLIVVLLVLLSIPTSVIVEYGTMALLFAIAGYMVRHKDKIHELTFVTEKDFYGFMSLIFLGFCVIQNGQFGLSEAQLFVMVVLTALTMVSLITMKPLTFPDFKEPMVKKIVQYCGRNTLDIYVVHLVIFKVILFASLALN